MVREVNNDVRSAEGLTVTVCGGGNAAHVAAGMYSHHGATVNLFLSLDKEAAAWNAAKGGGITVHKKYEQETYQGKVTTASTNPADVIPTADIILIIVPAFAHRPILESIGPHLKRGSIIFAMPAPGNFDLLVRQVLGPMADEVMVAGTVCLPWACRIEEYAKRVELLGEKSPVTLVARPASAGARVAAIADKLHDASRFRPEKLFLQATLFPTNPMLHPGIMYGQWSQWDGQPLAEKPLFYEGVSDFSAGVLEGEDADIRAIKAAMEKELGLDLVLPTLQEQMVEGYGDQIADPATYKSMLRTNSALAGLFHPTIETADHKWEPDFSSRYLHEDVPYGLCAMKGMAQLMGVPTPTIDKVLTWAQERMGKQFLIGDRLEGKDVPSCAAPQAFGITTREQLLKELRFQLNADHGGVEQVMAA